MAKDTLKLSKKTLGIIAAILIILIIAGVYYFKILPDKKKTADIQEYKKALYESILCQYKCPLQNYTIENKTQTIQQRECVVECINYLKDKGYIRNQYSNNEINSDNLAKDIEFVVVNCRQESTDSETGEFDSIKVTDCAIRGLEDLKSTYSYLN